MPVGRPDPDGDGVISAHRGYRGKTLGPVVAWECPSCGKKNDGRQPEQGCGHCGAGDPHKSRAGAAQESPRPAAPKVVPRRPALQPDTLSALEPPPPQVQQLMGHAGQFKQQDPLRILRLIEYRIKPGQNIKDVLRRSLVGTMDMGWGTITGTIVDSIDANQEDRLRIAHLQPGVWVANQYAMELQEKGIKDDPPHERAIPYNQAVGKYLQEFDAAHNAMQEKLMPESTQPPPPPVPDTGPAFSPVQFSQAQAILTIGGVKLCYTLALALQSIAQELEGNSEPEKFLSAEEALQLANALMQQVPENWTGEGEGENADR